MNEEKLSASTFSQELARKLKRYNALASKDPSNVKRTKDNIINDFVTSCLLRQFAAKKGLSVTPQEVEDAFKKIQKEYPDDASLLSTFADNNLSESEWRQKVSTSLLEKKAFALIDELHVEKDKKPDWTALAKQYYEDNKKIFKREERAHIRQIVVSKEDDAQRLLEKLKKGGDFKELARKFSVSPDAKNGGDIGFVEKGAVPAFDAAFKLRPGQPSAVVKSSYGYHILVLIEKRPAGFLPFEQVKDLALMRVKAQHQQDAFDSWLREALKSAKIEKNNGLIDSISVHTEN